MNQKHKSPPVKLTDLLAEARAVFNSKEKVDLWFDAPNRALSGDKPKSRIVTQAGLQQVYDLILRIKYGSYS